MNEELTLFALGLVSLPTIAALYVIFRDAKRPLRTIRAKIVLAAIIFVYIALAFLPLLDNGRFFSVLFVAFPLLYVTFFRKWIRSGSLFPSKWELFIIPFLLLWFDELFSVLDYEGPILQHFIFYAGFYLGIAAVIGFFYRRWQFSFAQLLTIGGLWGVLIEQNFMFPQFLLNGLMGDGESLLAFLFLAPFTFLAYGLYLAMPFLLFYEEIQGHPKAQKRQLVALFVAILTLPLLIWGAWTAVLNLLQINLAGVV